MPRPSVRSETAPAAVTDAVAGLGSHIATARQRRGLRQEDLAEKAGVSRPTIARVESGHLGTSVGAYAAALWAMGLLEEFADVAAPERDREGMTLEAARRGERVRADRGLSDDF